MTEQLKTCSCCHEAKPRSEFSKNIQTPDGLMYYCRPCAAEKQREFRKANPESVVRSRRKYLDRMRAKNLAAREAQS